MKTMCNFYRFVPMLVILGLAACSEGGSSGTGLTAPAGSHTTQGAITGFGSVFVNGVEYDSKASTITLDGVAQSEDKLAVGMVVKVNGSVDAGGKTGVATTIDYADELEGIVLSIDAVAKTVNVMGQTVHVTAETLYAGAPAYSLATMQINNVIEVSGYSSGRGDIHATRIELKKAVFAGEEVELKGVVANLNAGAKTFTVGTLVIDYNLASVDALGGLSNDLYVEIKSTSAPVNNTFVATKIEVKGDGHKGVVGQAGETLELEGIVTAVNSTTAFDLNGQAIVLNTQTQYENGTVANIVADTKLEVEGQFDASGNVIAKAVKFREASATGLSAYVSATDATLNTVTVLGLTVQIDNLTVLKDERDDNGAVPERYFGVKYLSVDDFVEMQFYKNGSGAWVATQLIRNNVESPGIVNLNGLIESVAIAGQLTVAGVTVQIPNGDIKPYQNGAKVEITGTYASNIITATAIAIVMGD